MTGNTTLDWALVGVSVFNVILQLWLGLTVLLNAERRSWGVWIMGGGLLLGGAFFISHTAILGQELFFGANVDGLNFWWQVGWIPVMGAPFAWYIVILWYAGFWNSTNTRLRKRHRWLLLIVIDMAIGLAFLMIFVHPIPTYEQVIMLDLSATFTVNGIPILFTLFPVFMILCIVFSVDALRRPEPADRLMGDLARERSRPWLVAASLVLLVVSVLVAAFIYQVFRNARDYNPLEMSITRIALYDLALESLVALAVILLGQAVVAYEVFTGKVLPRRGFFRQWRTTIALGAGYAFVIGWSLTAQLRPIYSLLLATLLMVVFYALYNWRSFLERERFMERLRPFVSSQGLMEQLVSPEDEAASSAAALFAAVCRDVLDAGEAHLIPAGSLSPLVGGTLAYPPAARAKTVQPAPDLLTGPQRGIITLKPGEYDGLRWAIPLWAERGRIGVLLLGAKAGGGLYTQEEIEIARGAGERIIDMLAGEQMARRLMLLGRGRLAESRVMDRRTRRALHDETLPTLHSALLSLSSLPRDNPAVGEAMQALTAVHQQVARLIHTAGGVSAPVNGTSDLNDLLRQTVQADFADEFNSITWAIDENLPPVDPIAGEVIAGAVREAARNAAVHGRGGRAERPLNLTIAITHRDGLTVTVSDDGVGLDGAASRPAAELPAGSGGGLILHSTMLAIVGGDLTVEAREGGGTRVVVRLPMRAEISTKPA